MGLPERIICLTAETTEIAFVLGAGARVVGVSGYSTNQRSLSETWEAIRLIGRVLGCVPEAERLAADLEAEVQRVRTEAKRLPRRPRIFFEEWDDPLILQPGPSLILGLRQLVDCIVPAALEP